MYIKYYNSSNKKYQKIKWIKSGSYLVNLNNYYNQSKKEINNYKRKNLYFQIK